MRILFDSCVYDLRNKGNVAMLQTAVNRIGNFWPQATLDVITSAPYLLRLYCPNARPISPTGEDYWLEHRSIPHIILQKIPTFLLRIMLEFREVVRQQFPGNSVDLTVSKTTIGSDQQLGMSQTSEYDNKGNSYNLLNPKVFERINLYVATGGHYLTDIMDRDVFAVLDRLELAFEHGIPIVMVGQGIGPIKDSRLYARVKAALPKVGLFLIRENLEAPSILNELGIDPSRVVITGDDAVEMAHQMGSTRMGTDIGVGFRVTHTTEANAGHMDVLKSALQQATVKYKCQLVGLPVSQSIHELDQKIIEQIFTGSRFRRSFFQRLSDPRKVIRDTTLCRVVITGTYHTAVFALSQGIPVIGLVKSESYSNKFAGLADQFKGGMEILQLDDEALYDKLLIAIDKAWELAGSIKPALLQSAERQVKQGIEGYECIHRLL
jgi:colanic acid/amylovoran biosynthesis protein